MCLCTRRHVRGLSRWPALSCKYERGLLKNYEQAVELARQAIAINPNYMQWVHATLVAALALAGHDAEAHDALKRYLALPSTGPLKTVAAWKAYYSAQGGEPSRLEANERTYDGLRKAGMPEE
jgi:adenylate cyclase